MMRISKMNQLLAEHQNLLARRWFLKQCGVGLGSVALAELLHGKFDAILARGAGDDQVDFIGIDG